MAKPVKIIAVSGKHHPLHKIVDRVCKELAEELRLEYELREDDYVFLNEHGVKDDFGFAGVPQIFVEYEDGKVEVVLHEFPLNERYKADPEKAKDIIREKLAS